MLILRITTSRAEPNGNSDTALRFMGSIQRYHGPGGLTKPVTLHSLRDAFACHLLEYRDGFEIRQKTPSIYSETNHFVLALEINTLNSCLWTTVVPASGVQH